MNASVVLVLFPLSVELVLLPLSVELVLLETLAGTIGTLLKIHWLTVPMLSQE